MLCALFEACGGFWVFFLATVRSATPARPPLLGFLPWPVAVGQPASSPPLPGCGGGGCVRAPDWWPPCRWELSCTHWRQRIQLPLSSRNEQFCNCFSRLRIGGLCHSDIIRSSPSGPATIRIENAQRSLPSLASCRWTSATVCVSWRCRGHRRTRAASGGSTGGRQSEVLVGDLGTALSPGAPVLASRAARESLRGEGCRRAEGPQHREGLRGRAVSGRTPPRRRGRVTLLPGAAPAPGVGDEPPKGTRPAFFRPEQRPCNAR